MGFWTGFFSAFNLFPETRSYDEIKEYVDSIVVNNPYHKGTFVPYAHYDESLDRVSVYFKDKDAYVKTLNNNVELHISFENEEIVGVNILRVKKLLNKEYFGNEIR